MMMPCKYFSLSSSITAQQQEPAPVKASQVKGNIYEAEGGRGANAGFFIGDLLFLGRDPLIHRHKNGNSFGLVKTLKSILKLGADKFIHGHGSIASPSDLEGVIKSLEEKQTKIKALIKEGKSLEEIKKIFNVEDRPPPPGRSRRPGLVETIYLELSEKK